ncbi:MAG: helix-turn-helix transcriptional regulator, partial [Treponema sp.]|nr:helix-turn-helix transcriptional regulator [Treponema sp.]
FMTKLQKQLAENIRFYRKKKGMTQENLAEKVGTATNYIGTIEIGKKFPSPKMIERIACALEVDELSLFSENIYNLTNEDVKKIESNLIEKLAQTIEDTFKDIIKM